MRLLFVLTLFVLVLLATCGRLERYTTEEFDKILEREEKEFFKFMKVKKTKEGVVRIADGVAFDYKPTTRKHVDKLRSKLGEDMTLRALVIASLILKNLRPNIRRCKDLKKRALRRDCREEKRKNMAPILKEYFDMRIADIPGDKKNKFRNNLGQIYVYYDGDLDKE